MGDFFVGGGQRTRTIGEVLGTSRGTTVTTGGADTKGSWVELDDQNNLKTNELQVYFGPGSDVDSYLVDIAVGTNGSEQVILENLLMEIATSNAHCSKTGRFPIIIPEGERISVRAQAVSGTADFECVVLLGSGGFVTPQSAGKVTTYGADESDSGGTPVDPGGSINTKGVWAEITAATTHPIRHLHAAFGTADNSTQRNGNFFVDIGIGSPVSHVIISNLPFHISTQADRISPHWWDVPISIPDGTPIYCRAQCDHNDATDRIFDVVLYGVS